MVGAAAGEAEETDEGESVAAAGVATGAGVVEEEAAAGAGVATGVFFLMAYLKRGERAE